MMSLPLFLLVTSILSFSVETSRATCTFKTNYDIGNGDGSTVIGVTRGSFSPEDCCKLCQDNIECSVSIVLDHTHGKNEGCWLKTGEGESKPKIGATICNTGRGPIPQSKPVQLKLLDLSIHPEARCMDGSPGAYYFATNTSSNSWVIELEGGGECASKKLCDSRKGSALYSSKYFKTSLHLGALNTDNSYNPKLRHFNRVFIPYCSQDLWTGQRTVANNDTYGYYFSGHLILEAVLDELDDVGNLKDAKNIILTGESAGGIGVWPNVDWLAERYPSARTVAAPIAGFYFFAYPYHGPEHTSSGLADFRKEAWPQHYKLWDSFVDQDCKDNLGEPAYCILSNNSFPFINVNAFIIEAQTDKVVLQYHDWIPANQDPNWSNPIQNYFKQWKNNMTIGLQPSLDEQSNNGVFNPACFIHTTFTPTSPILNGMNYLQAFQAWFFKEEESVKLQDDCGILCNPTCPH